MMSCDTPNTVMFTSNSEDATTLNWDFGDMTTGNLTGDEPRSYNFDIVKFPAQKVNVADLVGSVNIDGGTYTYTRETGAEGSIGAQTEGSTKNQKDYDFATVDVTTDFIAGFTRYSKKMRNNLSYITSAIPTLLRRDYFKAENSSFQAGEWLKFKLSYSGWMKAGNATLEIRDAQYKDKPVFHVIGKGWTTGAIKWFFKVDDRYESYFDKISGQPYKFIRDILFLIQGPHKQSVGFFFSGI